MLTRWTVGIAWAGWITLPAVVAGRPVGDILAAYAWCIGAAAVAVAVLWVGTLGIRR